MNYRTLAVLAKSGDFWTGLLLGCFSVGQIVLGIRIAIRMRYHPSGPKFTPIDGPDARTLGLILLGLGLVMTTISVLNFLRIFREVL